MFSGPRAHFKRIPPGIRLLTEKATRPRPINVPASTLLNLGARHLHPARHRVLGGSTAAGFVTRRDDRRILAGQLPAFGGVHRAVVPRGQSYDLRRAGRDLRAAGQQRRELAGAVAEAGRGPVAGPFLRRQPCPVAGSRRAFGRAPPGEPGRLRGALTPPRRLDSKLVSISLGFHTCTGGGCGGSAATPQECLGLLPSRRAWGILPQPPSAPAASAWSWRDDRRTSAARRA